MNVLENVIAALSPGWAAARARHRIALQAYEAADTTRLRKPRRENRSGDGAVRKAGKIIREQARALDEDHDLVVGIFDTFVANVVGPHGIQIEPMPRKRNGEIHIELAEQIEEVRRDWIQRPESTWEYDNPMMERIIARTWARDGECFAQHLVGNVAGLEHGTRIPYSLELLEPDLCPIHYDDLSKNIIQGIERNAWSQPQAFWFYLSHPGDTYGFRSINPTAMKRVPAARVQHIKLARRLRQARGISLLAPVLNRLHDVKEYEDSERIAAKMASAMAMYVKKGTPDLYEPDKTSDETGESDRRLSQVAPGMMWVDLMAGEEVGTIDVSRPTNLLTPFREAMLRAVAAGTQTSYSSISRNYISNYSARRQELVEQFMHYTTLQGQFIAQWSRPVYQLGLATAIAARIIRIPSDVDPLTIDDAGYNGPVMPWIDPAKEAKAQELLVKNRFKSHSQVIRERGGIPSKVKKEIEREQAENTDVPASTLEDRAA